MATGESQNVRGLLCASVDSDCAERRVGRGGLGVRGRRSRVQDSALRQIVGCYCLSVFILVVELFEEVGRGAVGFGECVGVDVEGHCWLGVAEAAGDGAHWYSGAEQRGRLEVA